MIYQTWIDIGTQNIRCLRDGVLKGESFDSYLQFRGCIIKYLSG